MATNIYKGSCHCGHVKYQIRLTMPPSSEIGFDGARIYKCNCSTCHKMGMFHCRPANLYDDFILTSPARIEEIGEYRCFTESVGWYFCKRCGVRTFGMGGEWVPVELDVAKWAGREEDNTERLQKVFQTKPLENGALGYDGKPMHYLSANGNTLDGIDLIEAHDKGWIFYVDNKSRKTGDYPQMRFKSPFKGGCY